MRPSRGSIGEGELPSRSLMSQAMYVRPLYLKASDGKIPELKRVIVAYQNQIQMADTLDIALAKIFGGGPTNGRAPSPGASPQTDSRSLNQPAPPPPSQQALATQAREHYQKAMQAQRDGNWALYGEEIRLLGESLQGLAK